jgi:hypothetical protein
MGEIGTMGPIGLTGPQGAIGTMGPIGLTGSQGAIGTMGPIGLTGSQGAIGTMGHIGLTGSQGIQGAIGTMGPIGLTGSQGAIGTMGSIGLTGVVNFSEFYDVSTSSNLTITSGASIPFTLNGPTNNIIIRNGGVSTSLFNLPNIGTYTVGFTIPLDTGKGQVALYLNSSILSRTVTGSGVKETRQGSYLITTTAGNQTLSINNPHASTSIVIPNVGDAGQLPMIRNIVITQIK